MLLIDSCIYMFVKWHGVNGSVRILPKRVEPPEKTLKWEIAVLINNSMVPVKTWQ